MKAIRFDTPVKSGDNTYISVNMRPSTMGDEEDAQVMAVDMDKSGVPLTAEMCLFSILLGIPYEDIRTLPPYEYTKLRAAYDEVSRRRPTQEERGGKNKRGKFEARAKPREEPDVTAEENGTTHE